jgi:hypothetical protein
MDRVIADTMSVDKPQANPTLAEVKVPLTE